jgi:hypothetical protein
MVTVTNDDTRDKGTVANNYSITNWTEDHALNCDTAADAEICDVLATLIADLIRQGILKGSVATA